MDGSYQNVEEVKVLDVDRHDAKHQTKPRDDVAQSFNTAIPNWVSAKSPVFPDLQFLLRLGDNFTIGCKLWSTATSFHLGKDCPTVPVLQYH